MILTKNKSILSRKKTSVKNFETQAPQQGLRPMLGGYVGTHTAYKIKLQRWFCWTVTAAIPLMAMHLGFPWQLLIVHFTLKYPSLYNKSHGYTYNVGPSLPLESK